MSASTRISVKAAHNIDYPNAYRVIVDPREWGERLDVVVHTDKRGEGFWIDGRQVEGTCQFSIGKDARRTIRRYFEG